MMQGPGVSTNVRCHSARAQVADFLNHGPLFICCQDDSDSPPFVYPNLAQSWMKLSWFELCMLRQGGTSSVEWFWVLGQGSGHKAC